MGFTLNGSTMKDPTSFTPTRNRVEVSERAADGTLVVDVVTVKQSYVVTYSNLSASELAVFTTLYTAGTFMTFTYPEGGSDQSKTVRIESITGSLAYYVGTTEYWENVRITLVEQ